MVIEIAFVIIISCVFFLSRMVSRYLSYVLVHITKSHKVTIYLLSMIFLPGVIIHELAHALVAGVLFVPVGTIEFMPVIHGNSVKLGSVSVAKTDPLRRFAIGVAPIVVGLLVLFSSFYYLFPGLTWRIDWRTLVLIYIVFEVGNTMFSSKKDLEGALVLFLLFCITFLALFLWGFRLSPGALAVMTSPALVSFFWKMDVVLLLVAGIDGVCIIATTFLLQKMFAVV